MNKRFLAYLLAASIATTVFPVQLFAAEANQTTTSAELVAETQTEITTASGIVVENSDSSKVCIKTNLVGIKDAQITNGVTLSYEWDDNWFFQDNTLFNVGLSKTAAIFTALSYYSSDIDYAVNEPEASTSAYALLDDPSDVTKAVGIMDVLESHAFKDASEFNLRNYYDDIHATQFNIAHKTIVKGEDEKELIVIAIRGTRAEMEWLSNFDLGTDDSFGDESDWTEQPHHRGFDITANRVVGLVEDYLADHGVDIANTTYMITGHSRGGALANLVGKKLEDKGLDTYTYTFAAPNLTLDENAEDKYPSIFNIVAKDDLVPVIPTEAWGFRKYGKTLEAKLTKAQKEIWEEIASESYSSALTMQVAVNGISDIMEDRNDVFNYNKKDITVKRTFSSKLLRDLAVKSIPEACLPYVQLELTEKKTLFNGTQYGYKMVQSPMYFITAAGLNLAGTMSAAEFLTFEVAEAYKDAKAKLIVAGIGGLSNPHYMETYLLLTYGTTFKDVATLDQESESQLFVGENSVNE